MAGWTFAERDRARARQGSRLGSWSGRGEGRVRSSGPEQICRRAVAGRTGGDLSPGLAADESFRGIAARLGRSPSTVSHEVGRHSRLV
ncbi:helix-turn-helix domain-containing protein [Streptomyces sp. NPDC055085]